MTPTVILCHQLYPIKYVYQSQSEKYNHTHNLRSGVAPSSRRSKPRLRTISNDEDEDAIVLRVGVINAKEYWANPSKQMYGKPIFMVKRIICGVVSLPISFCNSAAREIKRFSPRFHKV